MASRYSGKVTKPQSLPRPLRKQPMSMPSTSSSISNNVSRSRTACRCEAKTTIPRHDGGDPVPRRNAQHRVPKHLGIEVGVDVDESGRDDLPAHVDRPIRGTRGVTDPDEPTAIDRNVTVSRR